MDVALANAGAAHLCEVINDAVLVILFLCLRRFLLCREDVCLGKIAEGIRAVGQLVGILGNVVGVGFIVLEAFQTALVEEEKSEATIDKYMRDIRAFSRYAEGKMGVDKAVVVACQR